MTRTFAMCLFVVSAMLLCACDGAVSMLPKSGGRPYEVLVVASGKVVSHQLDSVLSQDVAGLPQSEPMFDVSVTDSLHFNQGGKAGTQYSHIDRKSSRFHICENQV